MDFVRYAESAAALLNAAPTDLTELRSFLGDRDWLAGRCTSADAAALVDFQTALRPVFTASDAGDIRRLVRLLNELLEAHPITPMISDHDPEALHLHVASRVACVTDLLISEALLGLASVVCELGPGRLGTCSAERCERVYIDTSPNQSRRYCSERCSSRANVAAYRARQKANRQPVRRINR